VTAPSVIQFRGPLESNSSRGFSLVEIMIVVVIIGILASIALPAFERVWSNSTFTAFYNDLRVFQEALHTCVLETGNTDQGSVTRALSEEFTDYVDQAIWSEETPIGGNWDVEYNSSGVGLAIGAHGALLPNSTLLDIDDKFDDGDLATGNLRKITADRFPGSWRKRQASSFTPASRNLPVLVLNATECPSERHDFQRSDADLSAGFGKENRS
jgi:prepilin-type N-terminal cleavage/methylation domain-containing protein